MISRGLRAEAPGIKKKKKIPAQARNDKSMTTFQEIANRWLGETAGTITRKTAEHYRWLMETYVFPRFGDVVFEKGVGLSGSINSNPVITEQEVREFLEELKGKGLSENTVYMLPRLIFRVLSYASAENLCDAPGWNIDPGTPKRKSPTVILSREQTARMSTYLTDNPDPRHLGMYLMLTAGLTVGEIRGLTWADVSFPLKRIRVLTERETTPDTRNKYRNVEMNEQQRLYLKRMASIPTVYVASGKPRPVSAYVLWKRFGHVLQELGLDGMPLSDLRRTFAVRALENGMGYERLSKVLGQRNSTSFRALFRELVTPETRERLDREWEATLKVREAPESVRPPEKDPEIRELEAKVDARKKQLKETLANLEGDLEIIHALRNSDLPAPGAHREGLYQFVEKVLGDDRDGQMLVEYLRCHMRVASMPSRKDVTVQTIRARVARGFAKLNQRLDAIYAVEGYDVLWMFQELTVRIREIAPPGPVRPGRKLKPTLENEFKAAMEALGRLGEVRGKGEE